MAARHLSISINAPMTPVEAGKMEPASTPAAFAAISSGFAAVGKTFLSGTGIGLAGINQNPAYPFGRAGEILLRDQHGRGPEQVGGEHAGGRGRPFADHQCQIVTGFALAAKIRRSGGQSEPLGKRHNSPRKKKLCQSRKRDLPVGSGLLRARLFSCHTCPSRARKATIRPGRTGEEDMPAA